MQSSYTKHDCKNKYLSAKQVQRAWTELALENTSFYLQIEISPLKQLKNPIGSMEADLLLFLLRTMQLNHLTITLQNNTDYNYKLGMCLLGEEAGHISARSIYRKISKELSDSKTKKLK